MREIIQAIVDWIIDKWMVVVYGLFLTLAVVALLLASGCMTEATQKRFVSEGNNVQICQGRVLDAKVKIAEFKSRNAPSVSHVVTFKDERNALTMMIVDRMVDMNIAMIESNQKSANDIDACDDIIVAMVRADSTKTSGLMSIGKGAVNGTLALIGLKIFADGFGPDSYSGSTAKTQNNYNSRVVSDSNATGGSSISSSGTGMGIGNTGGGADTVGGLYPRSQMDTIATDGGTNSNSGELTVIPLPEEAPVTIE